MKNKRLKSRFRSENGKIFFSKFACSRHVKYFFWVLPKDAQKRVSQDGQSQILKTRIWSTKKWKTLIYIDLFCSFHDRVADIKVDESPDFGHFKSIIKVFFFSSLRCGFFSAWIHSLGQYKQAMNLGNIKKHDLMAGLRKSGKSVSRYKARVAVVLSRFFGGRYF